MNLTEVKSLLYEVTERFFTGATVIWAEQINTKPKLPYVTLKCRNIQRNAFPVIDGDGRRVYHENTILEVNLYTKGLQIEVGSGITGNYENTAASDLTEFANYMESDEITDMIAGKGMDVALIPPVKDLAGLENDSAYRYRAMAEFTVSFAQETSGKYGIVGNAMIPNSSGGGSTDMVSVEDDFIEEVEIEEGGFVNEEQSTE